MFKYQKKYRVEIIISIIMTLLVTAAMLIQPNILAKILNEGVQSLDENGLPKPNLEIVDKYGIILIVIAVIGLLAGIVNAILSARVSQKIGADLRLDMFTRIQQFSFTDIENFKASNLVVRLTNDVNQVQVLLAMVFQQLIRIPVLFVGAFVLAMKIFPSLWWIIVLEIVAVLFVLGIINKIAFPSFMKYQKLLDKINAKVKDNFVGSRVVKSFVQEEREISEFESEVSKLAKVNMKIGSSFSIVFPILQLVGNGAIIVAAYYASPIIIEDMSRFGDLASYITYLGYTMFALTIAGFLMMMASRAFVSIKRINEILEYYPEKVFTDSVDITLYNDIEFSNVSFAYHSNNHGKSDESSKSSHNSLSNISFKIKKGQTIGVVGATGSGKSTLVNLLARLYSPQSGKIYVGGVEINKIKKQRFANELSVILQHPYLFSGSIQDNILDGNLRASQEDIVKSARVSQAESFIMGRDSGYNSLVLERGSNFSGGQKQRISIARGLVKNPSILIMDDSTSALDARSEKLVKEGLVEEYDKTTKIIVSQKISSVVDADKIIVLDNGKLDAFASHKELLETSDVYLEIYETQKGVE